MSWKATIEDLERRVARLEQAATVTQQRVGALVGRVGLPAGWSDVAEATAEGLSAEQVALEWAAEKRQERERETQAAVDRSLADAAGEIEAILALGTDHGKTLAELVSSVVEELYRTQAKAAEAVVKRHMDENAVLAATIAQRDALAEEVATLRAKFFVMESDLAGAQDALSEERCENEARRAALTEAQGELLVARQKHERTVEALNRRRDEAKAAKAELARLRESLSALVQPREPSEDVDRCEHCGEPLDRPTGTELCSRCAGLLVGGGE